MDEIVEELVNKKDSEPGLYTDGGSYKIWVRRWAEVLEENRQRLHFFRDRLSYVEPSDRAELDAVVDKYLTLEGRQHPVEHPLARSSVRGSRRRGDDRVQAFVAVGGERTPTLVIRGRSTSPWLREVARHLARQMPDAHLVELDGGHACILEHPEGFLAALGSHLEGF